MISIEEYKKNPCKASSIPYWKAKSLILPANMKITHSDNFNEKLLIDYFDEKYFRLIHRLTQIPRFDCPGIDFEVIRPDRTHELVDMINCSYTHSKIHINEDYVNGLTSTQVYCPELWIGAVSDGKLIGSILCDFDGEVGEAVIEWLQVLPEYRNRGIASALICKALRKISCFADFVTVSGECDNTTRPERVYRHCGFEGEDVWHILTKKE